jgi:hypothetical protein
MRQERIYRWNIRITAPTKSDFNVDLRNISLIAANALSR